MKLKFFLIFILVNSYCFSQITIGVKFGGIAYHPGKDGNEKFYKYKVNKKGNISLFKSITLCFSYYFDEKIGIKVVQTVLIGDCTNNLAGITHLGFNFHDKLVNWKNETHSASFSFGPMWYYRKNWNKIEGYKTNSKFIKVSKNKIWERKFVWYGGQIQYDYYFNNTNAASVNFLPGYPYIYALSAGITKRL